MIRIIFIFAFATILAMSWQAFAADAQVSHNVYFKLRKRTDQAAEQLMAGCRKYLTGHEGTVFFSVGVRAEDLKREVNDKDFDVALTVVFRDKAAHDQYQKHPRHLKFIEECQNLWESVRVFDAYLPATPNNVRK